ncbi:hypothetical protein [Endozoicomonas sp. SCSIO W0465]|uniref:hypothetical protein n=1 Tax=Endozoicomonas sp. SCSIO W0465 TaxID=2918516 RepID=UPI0020756526|nr:hypothetical protein [Endozoicomonas sp. SCSIO W0465]USE34629.1 hypothetical protein MJO57_21165 [Endozoicomonas sp. SCSIO W0465]
MDRPSGVGGSGQSQLISTLKTPDTSNNRQTITQTQGLRDKTVNEVPCKDLHQRSVVPKEPTSYLGWLATPAKEVARVTALFSYDLANTTYQTLTAGWSSIGQGVSEVAKLGLGTMGFAASLAQAGLAAAGELADSQGLAIADSNVDMLGWALAKAGIKTVGIPKSELRALGLSLARLHMGQQQDIHIIDGKLELSSHNDSLQDLISPQSPSSNTAPASPYTASDKNNAENIDSVIQIGNIHLEGIQPGVVKPQGTDRQGNALESLTIRADKLAFDVEYWPSDSAEAPREAPVTLSIEINQPELVGESNLLSLIATSINRYCSGLKHHLPGAIVTDQDDSPALSSFWNQEGTFAQLKSPIAHIEVKNLKSLAPGMSRYIPEVTSLSLIDLDTGLHSNLVGDQASKPTIFFESLEFNDNNAGPLHIRTGQMSLDEDMSGSLAILVQTPFSRLEEFMPQIPDAAKKKLTRNEAGENQLSIRINLDITKGDIDLNTLTALGVSEKKLPLLQKQIEKAALRALNSSHTRFRNLPSGKNNDKELKIDSLAIADDTPGFIKKKLHGITTKSASGYYDIGDQPYIKTGPNSRGIISLTELSGLEVQPGSNPPPASDG